LAVKAARISAEHKGIGLHGVSHFLKGFTAKAMSDFSQCHSLRVSQPQRYPELSFEDPVFGSKILLSQQQFLVHCPGDIGQYAYPVHDHSPPLTRIYHPILSLN
jgi:hypothetical protein